MEDKRKKPTTAAERTHAVDNYPGAAVDHADDNDVDRRLVKERTCTLNNNPRNQK